jgi:hypothetical protein
MTALPRPKASSERFFKCEEKDKALGHYRNAADLRAKIAEREPKDAKAQNELANIRAKIDKLTTDAKSSEGHLCSL